MDGLLNLFINLPGLPREGRPKFVSCPKGSGLYPGLSRSPSKYWSIHIIVNIMKKYTNNSYSSSCSNFRYSIISILTNILILVNQRQNYIYHSYVNEKDYKLIYYYLSLTHKILVIIVFCIVDDPAPVSLVEPAQLTRVKMFGVHGASTLEAGLSKTLVKALAQTTPSYLRMKFSAQTGVSITLERCVWSSPIGEKMRRGAAVRVFGATCYGWIYAS